MGFASSRSRKVFENEEPSNGLHTDAISNRLMPFPCFYGRWIHTIPHLSQKAVIECDSAEQGKTPNWFLTPDTHPRALLPTSFSHILSGILTLYYNLSPSRRRTSSPITYILHAGAVSSVERLVSQPRSTKRLLCARILASPCASKYSLSGTLIRFVA